MRNKFIAFTALLLVFAGTVAATPAVDSISLEPEDPGTWEKVDVTVEGTDDGKIMNAQLYWDGEWHTETCNTLYTCEKTFEIMPTKEKTYTLKARIQGSDFELSDEKTKEMVVSDDQKPEVISLELPNNPDPDERISIKVSAEDDEKVTKTQVYWDGNWYSQPCDSSSCENIARFTPTQNRDYTVKARAIDSAGQYSETVEKTLEVGTGDAPRVTGFTVSDSNPDQGEMFNVDVEAEDNQEVLNVQAYWDGSWYTKQCGSGSCEKTFSFLASEAGTYNLKVRAQDTAFEFSETKTKEIEVQETSRQPYVELESPLDSEVGATPELRWDSGDPDDTVTNKVYIDDDSTPFRGPVYTEDVGDDQSHEVPEDVLEKGEEYSWGVETTGGGETVEDKSSFTVREDTDDSPQVKWIDVESNPSVDESVTIEARAEDDGKLLNLQFEVGGEEYTETCDTLYSCEESIEFTPDTEGDYEVRVRAQDASFHLSDWNTETFHVSEEDEDRSPEADFTVSDSYPEVGQEVSFDASSSTDPDGDITDYSWEFGDGSSASGSSVEHSYDSEGVYTTTLEVEDSKGNTDTATRQINVAREEGSCGVSVSSNLGLTEDVITRGETAEASIKVYNSGDPQKVKVEFREGVNTVKTFEQEISDDKTFRAEVSPDEDTLINARVSTEGQPCETKEWIRSKELIVVEEQEANLDVHVENEDGDSIENALVSIDGEKMKETDSTGDADFQLAPGSYEVKAMEGGYVTETRSVTVSSGESKNIEFILEREEEVDRDLEIRSVDYSDTVCEGDTLPVDVTVQNTGDQDDVISISASGLGSNIQAESREIEEGENEKWTIRFTNVEGTGTEEFRVSATNTDSHTVNREVDVEDCAPASFETAERVSLELQPREAISGEAVKVRGFVDGTTSRTEVTIKVDGGEKARVSTQPDGYFETYIRVNQVGKHTVSATTRGASTSRELEIFPTASVNFVDAPREVFEGENFELCTEVRSQIEPKLVLFEDDRIVRTKNGNGDVCFDLTAKEGEHEYKVRALTYGEGGQAITKVNVLETDVETESFPSQIATVESGSGIVKVELYNTHEDLRRYDLELEGLPRTWVSQSEKQVILDTGERRKVYFYLTPQEEGSFEPTLSVKSKDGEIYREELPVITGGTTKPQKKSLWQRLREIVFY